MWHVSVRLQSHNHAAAATKRRSKRCWSERRVRLFAKWLLQNTFDMLHPMARSHSDSRGVETKRQKRLLLPNSGCLRFSPLYFYTPVCCWEGGGGCYTSKELNVLFQKISPGHEIFALKQIFEDPLLNYAKFNESGKLILVRKRTGSPAN